MPTEPLNVDIAVSIVGELVLTLMPPPPVNVEAEALVDDKILVTHSGHVCLSLDAVPSILQSEPNDRLVARTAVHDHPAKRWLQSAGRQAADPHDRRSG